MRFYSVTLRLPGGEARELLVAPDACILDAARAAGVELPHRCLQGWCLSCAGRLVAGQVDQSAARRYYPEDAEARYILLCTARPTSDAVVETHARQAMRTARRARGLPYPRGDWGDAEPRPGAGNPAFALPERETSAT